MSPFPSNESSQKASRQRPGQTTRRSSFYKRFIRPRLFRMDPERAHEASLKLCRLSGRFALVRAAVDRFCRIRNDRLTQTLAGLSFENPVGLAAGYDKNGVALPLLDSMGFGFLEIGSISANPSDGNPKPRLFRLEQDEGVAVHYGLPNDGAPTVANRLASVKTKSPLGINLVNTNYGPKAPPVPEQEILDDFLRSLRLLKERAQYFVLNLSCPNTELGGGWVTQGSFLSTLLKEVERLELGIPLFLKISPDGGSGFLDQLLEKVDASLAVRGFIFNLPSAAPPHLTGTYPPFKGAVSGRPVAALINQAIADLYSRMDPSRYIIIGAGGVFDVEDAMAKFAAGASLVQVYTGLIYEGPLLIRRLNQGLIRWVARADVSHLSELVGTDQRYAVQI